MRRYPPPIIHPPRGSLPVLLSVPHSGRDYARLAAGQCRAGPARAGNARGSAGRPAGVAGDRAPASARLSQPVAARRDRLQPRRGRGRSGGDRRNRPGAGRAAGAPRPGPGPVADPSPRRAVAPADRPRRARAPDRRRSTGPITRRSPTSLTAWQSRHGEALLLDCHSMPSRRRPGRTSSSATATAPAPAPWLSAEAARIARGAGFHGGAQRSLCRRARSSPATAGRRAASMRCSWKSTARSISTATAARAGPGLRPHRAAARDAGARARRGAARPQPARAPPNKKRPPGICRDGRKSGRNAPMVRAARPWLKGKQTKRRGVTPMWEPRRAVSMPRMRSAARSARAACRLTASAGRLGVAGGRDWRALALLHLAGEDLADHATARTDAP